MCAEIQTIEWVWTCEGDVYTFIHQEKNITTQVGGTIKQIAYILFDQFMIENYGEYGPFWIDITDNNLMPEIWICSNINSFKPELPDEFMNEMRDSIARFWNIKAFW